MLVSKWLLNDFKRVVCEDLIYFDISRFFLCCIVNKVIYYCFVTNKNKNKIIDFIWYVFVENVYYIFNSVIYPCEFLLLLFI